MTERKLPKSALSESVHRMEGGGRVAAACTTGPTSQHVVAPAAAAEIRSIFATPGKKTHRNR